MEIEIIDQPDSQDVKELDVGGGVYDCSYKPKTGAPKQTVLINYGGVAVPGSPFHVLNDNPNNPGLVKLYGPGVTAGQVRAKKPVEFTVDCTQSGPGDLKIKIVSSKRKSVPVSVLGKCASGIGKLQPGNVYIFRFRGELRPLFL